ncbi:MAG: V-type ATP synthase subunit F [Methanomicrobiales archaeon]|nr:V-type ATP synthase subunit F [Methanomicrobiales archaeon]MDI6875755.1 V-type ATP synthase subunit F [Methanomicrobiales archaeon]
MKIAVIGEETMVLAFELAGVHTTFPVRDGEEAAGALEKALQDPDLGVLVVQDSFAVEIEPTLERIRAESRVFPLILECPGPSGPVLHEDRFLRSVRRLAGLERMGMVRSDEEHR